MRAYDIETKTYSAFAWPGGYPIYHIVGDGGVLCPNCANKNETLTHDESDPQWYVVSSDINYEDNDLYCDNCYKKIESAYGDD